MRAARAQLVRPVGREALEQENKQLRAQLARAETECDMLKMRLTSTKCLKRIFTKDGPMKRFAFIAVYTHCWPVRQQCQLLDFSPSSYCAWCERVPTLAAALALPAWP